MSQSEDVIYKSRRTAAVSYFESSDEDVPVAKVGKSPTVDASVEQKKRVKKDVSDEEIPVAKKARKSVKKEAVGKAVKKENGKIVKKENGKIVKKENGKAVKKENGKAVKKENGKTIKKEDNGSKKEKTVKSKTTKKTVKVETDENGKTVKEQQEEEEIYKWWEKEDLNNEIKWTTLEHNGVMFPPPYEPLPKRVKLVYDGKKVDLPPEAEEVAGFFAGVLGSDHADNPTFQKNFFRDFKKVLKDAGGTQNGIDIAEFAKCDFTKIREYYDEKKKAKQALSSMEKQELRKKKEAEEAPYKYCYLDGRKEQVGNFRVEPPDLFRGRGSHPKTGTLKKRVRPEDITINIGKDAKVPEPPAGHSWAEVKHDNTGAWLAMWKENVLGANKYVRLAANSSLKGISDYKKFEKARELKHHIDAIRHDYQSKLKSKLMQERQMATATYLIDVFALRAGGEKGDDEADTVGCCSLRYEHVTLQPPCTVIFDFLGKDSIRFYQEVEVDLQVFKNLKIFKKPPKGVGDQLFDRIEPSILNKHFQNYMPGLTAKVFRTYNASKTMQDLLKNIPNEGTVNEKLLRFNAANREVAILCNHQRSVTKGHAASVAKITERIKEMEWQKIRYKRMMLQVDPDLKKKKGRNYFSEINAVSKMELKKSAKLYIEKLKDRHTKKFQRDNDKLKLAGEKTKPDSDLRLLLEADDNKQAIYLEEIKSGKISDEELISDVEKLQKNVEKLEERIANTTVQLKDREDNATVSLSTSKINYIDPRLSVVFSKRYNVPIEKLFTKTLRDKFKWAIESADENWEF